MFYTIYKVTNKTNGKFYIGKHQTTNLNDGYMGSGKLIQRAIKKHGSENFVKEILHVFDNEAEMNAKEAELVVICEDSYNLCPGGKGGWGYVNTNVWDKETRQEHNAKYSGWKTLTEEQRALGAKHARQTLKRKMESGEIDTSIYVSKSFLGKKHTEETKAILSRKNSIAQTGIRNSQYGTMWITNGTDNKKIKKDLDIPEGWYKGYKPKKKMGV